MIATLYRKMYTYFTATYSGLSDLEPTKFHSICLLECNVCCECIFFRIVIKP